MTGDKVERDALNRLMIEVRPRLHRYCARMVGSVFEGEDVVQEALAKAAEALPSARTINKAESWLFTIAHNTALDALRRRKRQAEVPLDSDSTDRPDATAGADSWVAATASLATIMQLPVIQRSTVVLMDVLEYSLAETAEILGTTLPAVKAALHRGRVRLKGLSEATESEQPTLGSQEQTRLRSYADRFNARDFDTLRDLLAQDVKLDLVNRLRLTGRKDVSVYFSRYSESTDWKLTPGLAEGHPALLVSNPADSSDAVEYVVLLDWVNGRVRGIHDFRYARYVTDGLAFIRL
ncbi:MAG: polymerase, sigma-24 subunit, subfamily [Gammaproteobacteria bacterium]|nr:polymerase, sigma-24 subunit, subfamily [Gammaproteobacteria bacterium]